MTLKYTKNTVSAVGIKLLMISLNIKTFSDNGGNNNRNLIKKL